VLHHPFQRRYAFSLVEVLTAMVIIGILSALLAGYYQRTVEKAKTIGCAANLRSLYGAVQNFAADHDGLYPSSMDSGDWPRDLALYLGFTIPSGETAGCPPCQKTVLLCPSIYSETGGSKRRSYCLNSKAVDGVGSTYDHLNSIVYSSKTALMADAYQTSWLQSAPNISSRHVGGYANLLFFDGHVETLTQADITARSASVLFGGQAK